MKRIRELFASRPTLRLGTLRLGELVFATTVIAGFFPVFFKQYWSAGADAVTSTAQLGFANSIGSVVILIAAPILGAFADGGASRKKYLGAFTALGVAASAGLWFVGEGSWTTAATVYVLGSIGFSGAIIFYDALIVAVSPAQRYDEVSAFGFSLGYIGGGILFALNVAMTLSPETFGLAGPAEAVRLSFVMVAAWWLVFSIPLFRHVPEPPRTGDAASAGSAAPAFAAASAFAAGLRSLAKTFREYRAHRMAGLFLLAYFFYIDGVHTIIRMAVDYGLSLGFPSESLIVACSSPSSSGFRPLSCSGWWPRGSARSLSSTSGWRCTSRSPSTRTSWTRSRSSTSSRWWWAWCRAGCRRSRARCMRASCRPRRAGSFFGFFNMIGRFAAILGPSLVAVTGLLTGSSRLGILSVVVLLVAGMVLLSFVQEQERAPAA